MMHSPLVFEDEANRELEVS